MTLIRTPTGGSVQTTGSLYVNQPKQKKKSGLCFSCSRIAASAHIVRDAAVVRCFQKSIGNESPPILRRVGPAASIGKEKNRVSPYCQSEYNYFQRQLLEKDRTKVGAIRVGPDRFYIPGSIYLSITRKSPNPPTNQPCAVRVVIPPDLYPHGQVALAVMRRRKQLVIQWSRRKRTYQREGVPGGEGADVGAGDAADAGRLEAGRGAVDDLEAAEARVRGRVLLRPVPLRRVQQHRRVAPLHPQGIQVSHYYVHHMSKRMQ